MSINPGGDVTYIFRVSCTTAFGHHSINVAAQTAEYAEQFFRDGFEIVDTNLKVSVELMVSAYTAPEPDKQPKPLELVTANGLPHPITTDSWTRYEFTIEYTPKDEKLANITKVVVMRWQDSKEILLAAAKSEAFLHLAPAADVDKSMHVVNYSRL